MIAGERRAPANEGTSHHEPALAQLAKSRPVTSQSSGQIGSTFGHPVNIPVNIATTGFGIGQRTDQNGPEPTKNGPETSPVMN